MHERLHKAPKGELAGGAQEESGKRLEESVRSLGEDSHDVLNGLPAGLHRLIQRDYPAICHDNGGVGILPASDVGQFRENARKSRPGFLNHYLRELGVIASGQFPSNPPEDPVELPKQLPPSDDVVGGRSSISHDQTPLS